MRRSALVSANPARTARTYPVDESRLARAIAAAVRRLARWELKRYRDEEVRAIRHTMLGLVDEVTIHLSPLESGAHTNTHARFESASRIGAWDLGRNRRNLGELLAAIDEELRSRE